MQAFKLKAVALVLLVLVNAGLWLWRDFQDAATQPVVVSGTVSIEIGKGDSFAKITDSLLARQVKFKPFWFKVFALQNRAFRRIKTGEYELPPGLTLPGLLALLVSGKTKQYAITFPEGWRFRQMLELMHSHPALEHTAAGWPDAQIAKELGVATSLEGAFFPDTYFFTKNTTDLALLRRAAAKMQAVLVEEWAGKNPSLPYKSPYEALIMASIVEKETGVAEERPLIAGVFVRRLQQGMRLQTDPTVIYGLGNAYQGDLTYHHLKQMTPYNTYLVDGLPPTPIAMPGRQAIWAALHPDSSSNLYFVARGDGSHVFSATLKAHNQAVAIYQKKAK